MSQEKGGLLFGVLMGTLLGILFAPKKGKELRDKFLREFQKGGIGLATLKSNFTAMGRDIIDTAQDVYDRPHVQKQLRHGSRNLKEVTAGFKKEFKKQLAVWLQKILSRYAG